MSYYDDEKNVEQYIKMAEGYDGQLLINILEKYLVKGSSVLELGMGAGKDLQLLSKAFEVTGSDASRVFLEHFKASNPDADVLQLDAVTLDTDRQFDAIYSNKVLYHLTQEQLAISLKQQIKVLNPQGIALHSFWYGEGNEEMHGLYFAYYTEQTLRTIFEKDCEVVEIQRYTEMEDNDSLYIVIKKNR
ncbi:MAG: methyltransferase domain-containing protein [Phototrophicaceae bacterium]